MVIRVYLDTNIFIEAFERSGVGQSAIWSVFSAVERQELEAVTSELTLAELLPKLIADGETELIQVYEQLMASEAILKTVPITRAILLAAADLRATRLALRLPDAIHLTTAAVTNCAAVLTNDLRLSAVGKVPIVPVTSDCLLRIQSLGS